MSENKQKLESASNAKVIKEINQRAVALNLKIQHVNEWVSQHPGTDPNYYEFIDLLVSFGELTAAATRYFEKNKCWPTLPTQEKPIDHYDAWRATPELERCCRQLRRLKEARKIGREGFTDFSSSELSAAAYHFFASLEKDCLTGMYDDCSGIFGKKKQLICQSFSVLFYIWQVQRKYSDSETEYQLFGQAEYQLANQLGSLSDYRFDSLSSDYQLRSLLSDDLYDFQLECSTSQLICPYDNVSEFADMQRTRDAYYAVVPYSQYKNEIDRMFALIAANSKFAVSGQQDSAVGGGKVFKKERPC